MKYEDVLKRFVSNQAQLLQERQLKQQLKEQMLSAKAQELRSFIPGMQGHSPEEEYTESEHNPFEEGQEFKAGGIHIDPSKKGTFKAQATRMGMSIQEAASHILNNKEKYSPAMVKKANFAKNFAKEEGGSIDNPGFNALPEYVQVKILNNMAYGGESNMEEYKDGGYTVRRTSERKGKTHVVIGPDGTKKYFGDPNMGERSKSKHGKDAFYARHADNLKNNPYFRAYARATWEEGGMITGDYQYPEGGTTSNPHLSFGVNANPEMGASVLPSINFQKGNFRANVSTMIPLDHIERYDRNFNVNADYNAGKYGDIGLSGSSYKDFEGRPTYSGSLNYEVPLTDRLNLMANLRANSLKDLKNSDASLGLRYSFENGGDMIKRADGSYSRRGLWDNIRDNRGSGKKPTKEMLEQERKIRREYATGGSFNNSGFNALPEAVQDKIIAAMMYGGNIDNNIWY